MPDITRTSVEALLDAQLVDRCTGVDGIGVTDEPQILSVVTHERLDHKLVDFEDLVAKHRPHPKRAAGHHRARTLDGVDAAIERFRNPDVGTPVLYHDAETLAVTVVLNDHDGSAGGGEAPGWRDHRIVWNPTLTPEWNHWTRNQGLHDQLRFAEILEDGEAEIKDPFRSATSCTGPTTSSSKRSAPRCRSWSTRSTTSTSSKAWPEGGQRRDQRPTPDPRRLA